MSLMIKIFLSLMTLICLTGLMLLIALSSPHALFLLQTTLTQLTPYQLSANTLYYDFKSPFSVAFDQLKIVKHQSNQETVLFEANHLSLDWIPYSLFQGQIALESLMIEKAEFNVTQLKSLPEKFKINALTLIEVDIKAPKITLHQTHLQLNHWQNERHLWGSWQGHFQMRIEQIEFAEHQFNAFLAQGQVDSNQNIDLHSLSFTSAYGEVSAELTLLDNSLEIEHFILSHSIIDTPAQIVSLQNIWQTLNQNWNLNIQNFDLIDFNGQWQQNTIEHLNLSAHQLELDQAKTIWNQNAAQFSFSADLIQTKQGLFTDLLGTMVLTNKQIEIQSLSAQVNDKGLLSLSGQFTPSHFQINHLHLANIELDTEVLQQNLPIDLSTVKQIDIEKLALKHINLTHIDANFPMQWFGIHLRGQKMRIREHQSWGLWRGETVLNATSAHLNHIAIFSPYIKVSADRHRWRISPFSISFQQGLLSLDAEINIDNESYPWTLNASGLQIPTAIYHRWLGFPVALSGYHDLDIEASGLARDFDSFAYSLSGTLEIMPVTTQLETLKNASLAQVFFPNQSRIHSLPRSQVALELEKIEINAHRGHIQVQPIIIRTDKEESRLQGQWDLVTNEGQLHHERLSPLAHQNQ